MADEDVMIEATAGPYAGKRLTMPAADAKKAIADGWARDPFAEMTDEDRQKAVDAAAAATDEDRQKVAEAAEKAARKLRGEEEADPSAGSGSKARSEDKAIEPEQSGSYEVRTSKPMTKK